MKKFDVYGVCNPLIDMLSHVPESFLKKHGIEKNIMHLVSFEEQQHILSSLELENLSVKFAAGGSAANSMIGLSQLGGSAAFSGKIGMDKHGIIYRKKLEELGVKACLGQGNGATGSSLVLVSDEGGRTMNTFLGMSQDLQANDIDKDVIQSSKFMYLTGYLWDTETQKKTVMHTLLEAKNRGIKVAFSLSDPFCVIRHKKDFVKLLQDYVSLVFCNQEEIFTLLDTCYTQDALNIISQWTETVVLTLGEKGALISHCGDIIYIDPLAVQPKDTTGAGDAFAGGYLYGITNDFSHLDSGRIGAILAGAVIEQTGPRYNGDAKKLVSEKLGIPL